MSRSRKVTYVEDAENDSGSSIEGISGTRKYASHDTHRSPSRERSSAGKYRGRDRSLPDTDDESITGSSLIDSDSTARSPQRHDPRSRDSRHSSREQHASSPRQIEREHRERESRRRDVRRQREDEERRRAKAEAAEAKERESRAAARRNRPQGPKHAATQPVIQQGPYRRGHLDDPAAYGVQQPAASGSRNRPRTRPASYYSGQSSGPPMANVPWQGQPPPPPSPFSVASFPPPHHMFPGGPGPMPPQVPPPPPSQMGPPGYFDGFMPPPPVHHPQHPAGEPLRSRFDRRPSSAMGYQPPPSTVGYFPEPLEYEEEYPQPRPKGRPMRSKRPEEGRRRPPPSAAGDLPKRTQSARPPAAPFRPPMQQRSRSRERQRPVPSSRRSVGFLGHGADFDDAAVARDADPYQDVSTDQRRGPASRVRRNSVAYDHHGMDLVPARSQGRRHSLYGVGGTEAGGVSAEDDKYVDALRYQENVSGGPSIPLTAESLRKASKRGEASSSRSTRSTGSHDESDYKRSNTTGITRSSSGANAAKNDDLTITVSRSATIRVPGAEIECNDGGEITVGRGQQQSGAASRAGSDKESTIYQRDDARSSRMDRQALTHRPRALSQVDTRSRADLGSQADLRSPADLRSQADLRSHADLRSQADLRSRADTRSRADLRSRAGSQTRGDGYGRVDPASRADARSRADLARSDFGRSDFGRSDFGRSEFERGDLDRAEYTPRSEYNTRPEYGGSRADAHSRYASSHYEPDPFEPRTYEHAPYDPALAASNFY